MIPSKNDNKYMKRITTRLIVSIVCCCFAIASTYAVPAKPGVKRVITLEDGTKVTAELRGDEHFHFYMDTENHCFVETKADVFRKTDIEECMQRAEANRQEEIQDLPDRPLRMRRAASADGNGAASHYFLGKKRAIVILMQFNDVAFDSSIPSQFGYTGTLELFQHLINERNFKQAPFRGSVRDYFIEQSDGKFEIEFDVVGPYTSNYNRAYYGGNTTSERGTDTANRRVLIQEAVNKAIAAGVNFSQYDWDDDGDVEEVFVLFAGQGENDGGPAECIWPHMSTVIGIAGGIKQNINGKTVTIKTYACSNELSTNRYYDENNVVRNDHTQLSGIGTFCHEFSHCLGYPDLYDIKYQYQGNQMGLWDLMCSGSYNGAWNGGHDDWSDLRGGYCPAGYTSFERWWAGWMEPKELDAPEKVTNLKPLGGTASGGPFDHGEAYVVYMPGSEKKIEGQYYLLENRQRANWDYALPWYGLLITYVHFDADLWENNHLNTTFYPDNDHERLTNFQACGKDFLNSGYTHLLMDTYPYHVDDLPNVFKTTVPFYNEDGKTMAEKLNAYYTDHTNYYHYNTTDNNSLDATTTPQAYYWTTEGRQVLEGQEIWKIENNHDPNRSVNFAYRKTTDKLTIDEDVEEAVAFTPGLYAEVETDKVLQNGKYNTLWLPFDMNRADIREFFGEDARVYQFAGVTTTGEGESAKTILNFEDITTSGLPAYTPVIVTLSSNDDQKPIAFQYPMQVKEATAPITTTADGWQFVGTRQVSTIAEGDYYLKDNKYYESTGNAKIKAYRAYLTAPAGTTMNANSFVCDFGEAPEEHDDEGWGDAWIIDLSDTDSPYAFLDRIEETRISLPENDGVIYNLNGQKVGTTAQIHHLAKGVYIIGGSKYIVK